MKLLTMKMITRSVRNPAKRQITKVRSYLQKEEMLMRQSQSMLKARVVMKNVLPLSIATQLLSLQKRFKQNSS